MKFILFNAQDTNKTVINKIQLADNHYINETTFPKSMLNLLASEPKGILEKIKYMFLDSKIEKTILKSLEKHDKKWYYILSKNILNENKYLLNKFEQMLGYKLPSVNEMDNNIFKYIDDYIKDNEKLRAHELKVLLVITNITNLNINLLVNLIKEYKCVNLYLKEQPTEYLLKRIKQINKDEGTTIEILKKERKSLNEFNIIYFIDDFKQNYPRLRINKNTKVIDLETVQNDVYNSNIMYLNELMNKQNTDVDNIEKVKANYNYLELSQVIKKITNVLDKS